VDEEVLSYTQRVAETCAGSQIQIVSGGASGVDQAGMLGVLKVGGTAVGVLADSLTKAAVAGKYRLGIKEGRLTLVSTYDPNAGFNVGNAMGRNKYIYGLADYALVVSSSFGKGGTWAGAIEAQEQIKEVPVFVRIQGTIPEGNRELVNKGAKPFPEEPWSGSLKTLLNTTVSKINATKSLRVELHNELLPDTATTTICAVSQSCPKDIYEAVIPIILEKLEHPKDAKSLAECLDVRLGQIQDWLKRAISEGKVRKTKNHYSLNQTGSQLSLLLQAE